MTTTLYIDVDTGKVSRTVGGPSLTGLKLFLRDVLSLRLGFVQDGVAITSTVLADVPTLKVGLRSRPGIGSLLALATSYTVSGQLALVTFSLNTAELVAVFAALETTTETAAFTFEVEVTSADEATRQTFCQLPAIVGREVNTTTDTAPTLETAGLYVLRSALFDANGYGVTNRFTNFRPDLLGVSGGAGYLDGLTTSILPVPFLVTLYIAGELQDWLLETSTAATGESVQRPSDYNAATNTKVWTRKR